MKKLLLAAAIGAMAISMPLQADHHANAVANAALEAAVAADWRAQDRERDQYRHPRETLEFFGVEPGMTVVDYVPGDWYAKILIPYLGSDGRYIGATGVADSYTEAQKATRIAFPEAFPRQIAELMEAAGVTGGASVSAYNNLALPEELTGQVDRVLIFRFMHNLHRRDLMAEEMRNFRKLLKEDGMLGIVQHRARADAPYSYADGNNGYLRQEDVIKLVEGHGFELVATSEINANPNDPADHIGGVWQIQPSWNSKDEAKKAIGESDRMTLLFKKRP